MIPLWLQACIYQTIVCYLTTSIAAIHFYCTVIISRQHLKQSILSRVLCLLHILLIVAIRYIKQAAVALRKVDGTVFILEKQLQTYFFKGGCLFHRTSCNNFCFKVLC